MITIYVIGGTTGEYSDRSDWIVCAYRDKALADLHVHNAQIRAIEINKTRESRYAAPKGANEFDPHMQMDYTGTEYYLTECELKDATDPR